MEALHLAAARTALVAIDLQNSILSRRTQPWEPAAVVERTVRIADALRAKGGLVIWVRVAFSADGLDRLQPVCDQPFSPPNPPPPGWADLPPALGVRPADLVVTKRQWGAFYGTDLDLQLRRRGLGTIILTGIATTIGVESTARDAFERGYELVLVEDAMSALAAAHHEYATTQIFPRIGRVRRTAEVLAALA